MRSTPPIVALSLDSGGSLASGTQCGLGSRRPATTSLEVLEGHGGSRPDLSDVYQEARPWKPGN
jgi:hypothetical protein